MQRRIATVGDADEVEEADFAGPRSSSHVVFPCREPANRALDEMISKARNKVRF